MPANELEEVRQLQRTLEQLERELAESDGAMKQLDLRLRELGFKTLKEAEAALPAIRQELSEIITKRDKVLQEFEASYAARISGIPEPPAE